MKIIFANYVLEVLTAFFLREEEDIHQAKIATISGLRKLQVQRALQRLREAGLIEEYKQGSMIYYKLIHDHPILNDLKSLLYKTVLIVEPFKSVFSDIDNKIDLAFIYGSFASGTEDAESDIDIFIVGDIGLKKISKFLVPIAKKLHREINPIVFSKGEFIEKVQSKEHFVTSVLRSKKMWLIGDDNELKKVVK